MRFAPGLPAGVLNSAEALVTADHISYTRYVSEETGWTYFITSPANLYFTDNLSTIGFLGGVFAVYLLLGLFLVRRIARRSYRPVKDINDLILQSAPGGAGDDEFAVIKSTLLNQMRSGTELQRIIEAQRPAVVRDLLLQLLLGHGGPGQCPLPLRQHCRHREPHPQPQLLDLAPPVLRQGHHPAPQAQGQDPRRLLHAGFSLRHQPVHLRLTHPMRTGPRLFLLFV